MKSHLRALSLSAFVALTTTFVGCDEPAATPATPSIPPVAKPVGAPVADVKPTDTKPISEVKPTDTKPALEAPAAAKETPKK